MPAQIISLRYPFTGDVYTAEGPKRIKVERQNRSGYFDDSGRWLEGMLREADPCFCRFLSSTWILEQDLDTWGLISAKRKQASNRKAAIGAKANKIKKKRSRIGSKR